MRWLVYLNFEGAFSVPVAEPARARIATTATTTQAQLTPCARNWRRTFKIGVPSCDASHSTLAPAALLVERQCLIQLSNIKSNNRLPINDGHWSGHEAQTL